MSEEEWTSLIRLAKILAHDVLPTPLGPQKSKAWGMFPEITSCSKVSVICF